jgi:hypothetical protein
MAKYKIQCKEHNRTFVETQSYQRLLETFSILRSKRGNIIHVVGAPGTGKSINICAAQEELGLDFYEVKLILPSSHLTSRDVFNLMIKSMKEDLEVNINKMLLKHLKKFDAIVFADQFHDYHLVDNESVGFSQWTDFMGLKTFNFYFICIWEYLKHWKEFQDINLVLQTAWRIRLRGKKKDLFTDVGLFSKLALILLKVLFNVAEISYSEKETISIVKNHLKDVDEDLIKQYIKKYRCKPRFICQAIKKRSKNQYNQNNDIG